MIAEDFEYLKIPVPSYIECGHQLRLIYLLNSPVAWSLSYANRAFRAIRRIQEHICDHLNATFGCGAEIQPITSFYRMSGSVNRKDDSVVTIWKVSGLKYEISELIDEYLPDLPLSKEEYRLQEKKKKKSAVSTEILQHNQNTLCSFRMSCFESLREFASNNNRREILTFLYVATALTIYPEKDPVELAEDFNSGFPLPLPHNEIRYSFRTCHSYSFTTETIARKLGLSIEDLEKYGLRAGRRAREKAAKEARGETRKQLADRNYENYKNLADKGVTRREIAKQLGLSVETLKKYRARRYKEESQI